MSDASVYGQANASSDASDFNSLSFIISQALAKVQTVTIASVKAVHTATLTVDVLVLVNLMTGAGTPVQHSTIYGLPYFRLQGGTSGVICDPVAGDIGIVVFGSRDLSGVISSKAQANPGSARMFDWSDGMYIGGVLNTAPAQYLQFASGGITLLSPTAITIQSPDNTITGPLTVTGETTFDAAVIMDTTLNVTGATVLTGGLTAPTAAITTLSVTTIEPIGGGSFPSPVFPVDVTAPITGTGLVGAPITLPGLVTYPGGGLAYYYGYNTAGVLGTYVLSGGGGGGGTVTSVGISTPGLGVVVGGGPISTSGTLTVDLSTTAYAALVLATTALQPVSGLAGSYTSANLTISSTGQITAVSNGSGGGSSPYNITAFTHTGTPSNVANDEFDYGTSIDTAGARFAGAIAWTGQNLQSTGTLVSRGSMGWTGSTGGINDDAAYTQPITAPSSPYEFELVRGPDPSGGTYAGLWAGVVATGAGYYFGYYSGTLYVITQSTYTGSGAAVAFSAGTSTPENDYFFRIGYDGTNMYFQYSYDGVQWDTLGTVAAGAYAIDSVGIFSGGAVPSSWNMGQHFDYFRRNI
jgi:hypothetical protein